MLCKIIARSKFFFRQSNLNKSFSKKFSEKIKDSKFIFDSENKTIIFSHKNGTVIFLNFI